MVVSPSFALPFRAMPPISQKRARRHTGKLGETFRGTRGFLLTQGATAYGRGHKAARRVDANLSRGDHRQHGKTGNETVLDPGVLRDGQEAGHFGKREVPPERMRKKGALLVSG